MENSEEKKGGINLTSILSMVFGILLLFSLFSAFSGCISSFTPQGILEATTGVGGEAGGLRSACSVGFLTFGIGVSGWFLGLAGTLFDYAFIGLVVSMGGLIGKGALFSEGIELGWTIIRNMVNLAFIGGLIYAAISMILQSTNSAGKMVVNIIIAAVLVNFSFFFGAVIIDASNFVSLKIYEEGISDAATVNPFAPGGLRGAGTNIVDFSAPISERFMAATQLGSLHNLREADFAPGGSVVNNPLGAVILASLGIILFNAAASIFFVGAAFLIIRFVVIVILLILSPIGILYFSGIPLLAKYGKAWWETLFAQALFPVVFLLLIAISLKTLELGLEKNPVQGGALHNLITSPSDLAVWYENLNLLLVYAVALVFMFFSLRIASSIAQQQPFTPPTPAKAFEMAQGLEKAVKWINPRTRAFKAAANVFTGEGAVGGLRKDVGTALKYGTGIDLITPKVGKGIKEVDAQLGRVFPLNLIPGEDYQTRTAQKDREERRKDRLGDLLNIEEGKRTKDERDEVKNIVNALGKDPVALAKYVRKSKFSSDKIEQILESIEDDETRDQARKEIRSPGSTKNARGNNKESEDSTPRDPTSTTSSPLSNKGDLSPVVKAVDDSDSHEALRDNRALNNAVKDRQATERLVAEMRANNVSLAKLPTKILKSRHVRDQLTVKDLHDVGRNTKDISYEEYESIRKAAPKKVRDQFKSGPGRYTGYYGRPVGRPGNEPRNKSENDDLS